MQVAAPLENIANNLSPKALRRRDRWALRGVLWSVSSLARLRHCGRVPRANSEGVTLRSRDGVAGFAGLQHCGSVWACPCCGGKILTHRALEIGAVLGAAVAEGYSLGFFTLTMRHRDSQALDVLWSAGQKAWQRAISGKYWVAARDAAGVEGWVRVWETSIGANGWHVHVHGVVVLPPGARASTLDELCSGMFERWSRGLEASGLDAPLRVGQEWHVVEGDDACDDLAGYLFKVAEGGMTATTALGLELTHAQAGRSRRALSTRPVVSLLDDLVLYGEAEALERWHEWERVSKGKRQVGYSKGLRDQFAPGVEELSDEQVAELEHGSCDDDLVHFGVDGWRQVVADPTLPCRVLEAAEAGGVAEVRAVLDGAGVAYTVCVREPERAGNIE